MTDPVAEKLIAQIGALSIILREIQMTLVDINRNLATRRP